MALAPRRRIAGNFCAIHFNAKCTYDMVRAWSVVVFVFAPSCVGTVKYAHIRIAHTFMICSSGEEAGAGASFRGQDPSGSAIVDDDRRRRWMRP